MALDVYASQRIIYQLARELHRRRGGKAWDDLTPASRTRWAKEAQSIAWNVPDLRDMIWGR